MTHDKAQSVLNETGQQAHTIARLMAAREALHKEAMVQRDVMQRALDALPVTNANREGRALLQGELDYGAAQREPRGG